MLFSQPRQRAVRQRRKHNDPLSPEQVQRSIERDLARTVRARRKQEENLAEEGRVRNARSRFELARDQIVFGLRLAVTLFCIVALAVFALTNPQPIKLLLTGGGTIVGIVSLLFGGSSLGRNAKLTEAPLGREREIP